jgi:protein TonB
VTRPVRENFVTPSPIKQKVEAAPPPSPVPPIAASPQAKEPTSLHSVPASAAAHSSPVASGTPAVSRSATSGNNDTGTVIGPSYGAAYLHNPPPPYPPFAKKHNLQGTPIVRVLVSPEGQPKSVELEKTSGVRILDDAAVEAVKHWTFVPARRGNTRIEAPVNVPILFHLK